MAINTVTVFGGTGYLGRVVVDQCLKAGLRVRVAARTPTKALDPAREGIEPVTVDVRNPDAVRAAIAGADAVVNAVGLYVEHGGKTFRDFHVDGASRVAAIAREHGVARLVHMSGIGVDATSRSNYVRSRTEGEAVVREAFPDAVLLRPSALFGPSSGLIKTLTTIVRKLPVIPMFGRGDTRLAPAHVDDAAQAIVQVLTQPDTPAPIYELGGADVLTWRQLLEKTAAREGRRPMLMPLPFALWYGLADMARILPKPPLDDGPIALLRDDNVPAPDLPGFAALGLTPSGITALLEAP